MIQLSPFIIMAINRISETSVTDILDKITMVKVDQDRIQKLERDILDEIKLSKDKSRAGDESDNNASLDLVINIMPDAATGCRVLPPLLSLSETPCITFIPFYFRVLL